MNEFKLTPFKFSKLEHGLVTIVNGIPEFNIDDDTVILKILFTGICRADVKEVRGSRDIPLDRGALFGHELIGEVVQAGNCPFISKDQLVTFNPNITPNRTTGFAEYFMINANLEELKEAIIPLPENFNINEVYMPEPFACIVHSLDKFLKLSGKSDLKGMRIGILGMGNSGIIFGQYAKYLGGDVNLYNRKDERIDFAKNNGIFSDDELFKLENYHEHVKEYDIVIIATTRVLPNILEIAIELVKDDGYIHIYGGTRKGNMFLDLDIDIDSIRRDELSKKITYMDRNITLSGAYGCSRVDFEKAFDLYDKSKDMLPMEKLVSSKFKLEKFPEVIMGMSNGERDYPGKVIIC